MKKVSNKNYKPLIDAVIEGWYREKVDEILERFEKDNITLDYTIKNIQALNKEDNKDGSYAFNKIVEKVKAKKYPKDVEEQIIEEFKHAFLAEFYVKKEEKEEKRKERQRNKFLKQREQLTRYVDKHIFEWAYSDFEDEDLKAIGNEIASAPIEIQKQLIDLGHFRYFTKPSEEIITYALENGDILLDSIKNRNKNIDLIAAKLGAIAHIKEIKDLSEEAKLVFIENNPDEIITKITAENFNTKELTIYDLNKKELEAYNKGIEARNKKEKEKQIELVKKDPREIYKIKNPSKAIRNYAIEAFTKQWER